MKKTLILAAVGGLFFVTSCKKDYTCECTFADSSIGSSSTTSMLIENSSKKDAEAACNQSTTVGTLSTNLKSSK